MSTVAEHCRKVAHLLRRLHDATPEQVPLAEARGRVLARDVTAPVSLPPFDNSQMDGYALRTADLDSARTGVAVRLQVASPIPAGTAPADLRPGSAAPIMTGAMLPAGADAVVPIEQATPDRFFADDGGTRTVELPAGVPAGQYVRVAGSDIGAGDPALPAGTLLLAPQLGLLAALGMGTVPVRPRPVVLLLSTGDEVVAPGAELPPGGIYDANTTMLRACLEDAGAVVRHSRLVTDDVERFQGRLAEDLAEEPVDLVVTAGGISKGAYEVVRQGLADHPVEFGAVAMQPGGPQAIGSIDSVPFLGFPGNPVSCLVSFETFLRPALSDIIGYPRPRPEVAARLAEPVSSPEHKLQVRRGRYFDDGTVQLIGGAGSHLVHALAEANALVQIPEGTSELDAGDDVQVRLLDAPADATTKGSNQ
ncbi:gephyrin-like molybdotransferase Glp [Arthrobacter castelli]|uniref:molybdopterin molybdotransferase MoeA n=1 Tax=Arthrobacter castelli TaxID=271431 RepID=UPI0003F83CAC|nr:gephyrin-like molybdotransferase Glp [Arthrobacter castelli]